MQDDMVPRTHQPPWNKGEFGKPAPAAAGRRAGAAQADEANSAREGREEGTATHHWRRSGQRKPGGD